MIKKRNVNSQDIFIPDISRLVIDRMVKDDENKFVILDASLDRSWDIYYDHVKELRAIPIIIRLTPPIDIIRERLRVRDGENGELLNQLGRFKSEFDDSCRHVKADITVGELYDYTQVLHGVKDKLSSLSRI